jgi:hypothetical protein
VLIWLTAVEALVAGPCRAQTLPHFEASSTLALELY